MSDFSAGDFAMEALKGFVEVEKAKVGARLGATDVMQQQGLSTAPMPRDPQAKSQSYTAKPTSNKMMWLVGGIAALVVGGLVWASVKR